MRVAFYSISLTTRQHVVPVLHSWAAVVVPVRLGLLLRWLGMIVVVPDGNPVQTLLKLDSFVGWDLQEFWDNFVHNAIGSIGIQYPDLGLAKYSCLRSSDAWLDDGIIGQFIQYLECGMPLAATSSVTEWIPDPPLFKQKNSIDFGELLILDPQTAFKINAAHESGQWEPVLRIISAKCTFANVKRILLPMNVANSDLGYCIAGSGNGVHFILTEVNLVNDAVCIYDWLGNHPNSHYAAITGNVPSACLPYIHSLTIVAFLTCTMY